MQRGGQHVDALGGAFPPGQLAAEQPPAGRVHQPDMQRRAARVVLGPGPGDQVGGHRVPARGGGLGQAEPGARDLEAEHLHHRGADHARERRGAARGHGARHPAGLVGRGPQRHPGRAAEHQVRQGHGVAHREHVRQRRAHPRVDQDRAVGQVLGAGLDQQVRGRADAGGDHHQVGGRVRAADHRGQGPVRAGAHLVQPGAEAQPGVAFQLGLDQGGDRFVHGGQDARQRLDDLGLDAGLDQGLGRLQADVAGPDHDRAADHAGVQQLAQLDRLVQGPDREHPGMVEPGHRRAHRVGAGGHDQPVVAERAGCRPRR